VRKKVIGHFFEAHWVVQTHFNNRIQVMDPAPHHKRVKIEPPSFQDWMESWRTLTGATNFNWKSMGLDLEIAG
jgi:hypothetical protein